MAGSRLLVSGGTGHPRSINIDESLSFAYINFRTFTDEFDGSSNFALLQSLDLSQRTNQQFSLSLRQTIYLYVFGNQMGEVNITGSLFASSCDSSDGFTKIMAFYTKYRLSSNTEPVDIEVGGTTFEGYLTGLKIHPTDPNTLLTPFSMDVRLLPFDDELGEALNPSPPAAAGTPAADTAVGVNIGGGIASAAPSASNSILGALTSTVR